MNSERKNTPKSKGQKKNNKTETMRFENFLETVPLYVEKHVTGFHKLKDPFSYVRGLASGSTTPTKPVYELTKPSIQLFCPSPLCNGIRWFEVVDCSLANNNILGILSFMYQCRNCKQEQKLYTIIAEEVDGGTKLNISGEIAKVQKIGEFPQFRPHISNRVISLIEPDKELFNKGLSSENKGLGIGAFTYYRRVVDNQWRRLLNKIKEAAIKQEVPKEIIQLIEEAEKETQFGKAVDILRDAIPKSLYIKTHNPITLLHDTASVGLHGLTDEQCLDTAGAIRIILSKLADNIHQAIKDDDQIKAALTKLHKKKEKNKSHQSKP